MAEEKLEIADNIFAEIESKAKSLCIALEQSQAKQSGELRELLKYTGGAV